MDKAQLLCEFREQMADFLESVSGTPLSYKKKATALNNCADKIREAYIEQVLSEGYSINKRLEAILLITYVSYIVMLEYRNAVWPYEYMAFSRRIGELWEPMCKLPFLHPLNELSLYTPPDIGDVKNTLKKEVDDLISNLSIDDVGKKKLLKYYQSIWALIDNGGNINLTLDLHFEQEDEFYDVDYKSGFSSNEKGNTNRLLLVASIYKSLPEIHNNLIFLRQKEEENNHYLQTLKRSGLWDVYCADETYAKIHEFTGFDLKNWMFENMDWQADISSEFREYLQTNDLIKYLTW
ncbi:MAG: hypothetical protein LBK69_07750 [Syntrophomonadaceae bacterium]|nr:hypothetical protein [Syntrophomonadaceae bacterium]